MTPIINIKEKDFYFIGLKDNERQLIALIREYDPTEIEMGGIIALIKHYFVESVQSEVDKLDNLRKVYGVAKL